MFIPKANKKDKLIHEYIKSDILKDKPLNRAQFAYQTGKSTISALHSLVTKVEKTFDYKELLLAAFLDVEGAFDNASFTSMKRAMKNRGFSRSIIEWIEMMLSNREISIVPFTKRRKISIPVLKLGDAKLSLSSEVKYLGVILDSKLSWNRHVEQQIEKARNAFWGCKRSFGRKWGIKPKRLLWIYMSIDHLFYVPEINRQDWKVGEPDFRSGSTIFYTDGSKQDNVVGAGISGPILAPGSQL